MLLLSSADFFSLTFSKNSLRNTFRVANGLDQIRSGILLVLVCLFCLICFFTSQSTIFQLCRVESSLVKSVLSKD